MTSKNKYVVLEWLIKILGYALVLITVSIIFKNTIYIDNSYWGLWAVLASLIVFILNKTIKPILVWLTLPITALTLGLFYPIINVIILNIVDFILGSHFKIQGIFMSVIVAIIISIMNFLLNDLVINNIIGDKHE
ncbi:MAG: phage holin family protein [Firmicutes bacterium]|nr:phage holin family protein [Bacillota bacterium]